MKTYENMTTYATWAALVGLLIAVCPGIGFGQDGNDVLANEVVNEDANLVADESANVPVSEDANAVTDEPADETTGEAADASTEPANEPVNEAPDEPMMRGDRSRRRREGVAESGRTLAAYSIVTERNMFSRNREPVRPKTEPRQHTTHTLDPNPESYYILRGIVGENGTFIAFFQDNRQGTVLELREGDEVARGKIKSLTLDSIEYEMGDTTTTVPLGYDLEGGRGALNLNDVSQWSMPSYPSNRPRSRDSGRTSSGSTSSSSQEPLAGDDAELLRRLIERRQQQMQ